MPTLKPRRAVGECPEGALEHLEQLAADALSARVRRDPHVVDEHEVVGLDVHHHVVRPLVLVIDVGALTEEGLHVGLRLHLLNGEVPVELLVPVHSGSVHEGTGLYRSLREVFGRAS